MILLDFVAANICVYFQYLFMHFVCANILGAIVLKPRFKIDVVIMIICNCFNLRFKIDFVVMIV